VQNFWHDPSVVPGWYRSRASRYLKNDRERTKSVTVQRFFEFPWARKCHPLCIYACDRGRRELLRAPGLIDSSFPPPFTYICSERSTSTTCTYLNTTKILKFASYATDERDHEMILNKKPRRDEPWHLNSAWPGLSPVLHTKYAWTERTVAGRFRTRERFADQGWPLAQHWNRFLTHGCRCTLDFQCHDGMLDATSSVFICVRIYTHLQTWFNSKMQLKKKNAVKSTFLRFYYSCAFTLYSLLIFITK
jgi:hypothetical protein